MNISNNFSLVYMNHTYKSEFTKNKHPNQFHYHKEGEKWYLVLSSSQKLQIGKEELVIKKSTLKIFCIYSSQYNFQQLSI